MRKLLFIVAILAVLISGVFLANIFKKNKIKENRTRLIQISLSRENIFWECFKKQVEEEKQKWRKTDEYFTQQETYNKCEAVNNCSTVKGLAKISCSYVCFKLDPENNRPWQLHNENASQFCSRFADNTPDGQLVKKLRGMVPIEVLTDHELQQIIEKSK